ncbi:ribokinase [Komagataeibacter medellinensis]|uniref:Ribokinase n=1 Tax=Komagataeibacter medellinensis (strain NBRC 3288 / BCRC 11682 / LMG 1693 / Kondo 51) TaxID=634177 RepID=G2I7B5_KOMMN|nr:ribokinase [Komagataeibacter medellinensis]BAK84012.1 heptose 7-phosphate kinase/heptose 1-phosphate adenyltransferase [Komagataeibacter medellinensis NBRC 3288]
MSSPCTHIAVIGSTNIDFVMHVTRFAQPGETMHVRSSSTGLGGKGANQAMAVARLGQTVALAGWTGQDMLADMARTTLEAAGVNTRWLLEDTTCGTGRAFITINAAGQNQILVDGGANMAHTDASLAHILPALDGAGLVMMQMEMDPTLMLAIARHARAHAIPVMLDPAPVPTDGLPEALCALADLITPNERETAALTGIEPTDETTALAAARILHARGVGTAIIKLGHRGVVYSAPDAQGFVPPFRVHAIDTVAAGDCFNAGLATALVTGHPLGQAVRIAAACGALATTRAGAAQAAPTMDEVMTLMATQSVP